MCIFIQNWSAHLQFSRGQTAEGQSKGCSKDRPEVLIVYVPPISTAAVRLGRNYQRGDAGTAICFWSPS